MWCFVERWPKNLRMPQALNRNPNYWWIRHSRNSLLCRDLSFFGHGELTLCFVMASRFRSLLPWGELPCTLFCSWRSLSIDFKILVRSSVLGEEEDCCLEVAILWWLICLLICGRWEDAIAMVWDYCWPGSFGNIQRLCPERRVGIWQFVAGAALLTFVSCSVLISSFFGDFSLAKLFSKM